ncbi:MAG: tetratricopeptide repeat protein [Kiloniellaceae bacterium]
MLFFLALAGTPAAADQTDARLDGLFARLKTAPDARAARGIEAAIWAIWIDSDDEVVGLLMQQGIGAMTRRDYRAALRSFDQMVKIAPDFAEGWNKRATVHYMLGHYGESLRDIDRTLKLEPRHFGALSGRGLVYIELDEEELALDSFEAALKIHPLLPGANHNAEVIRDRLGNREI